MRYVALPVRFIPALLLFAAALVFAGCPANAPLSHAYSGSLSENFVNRVLESYSVDASSGEASLLSALMDTDGDDIFDVEIALNGEAITDIKEVTLQAYSAKWPPELLRGTRPDKMDAPKPLLALAAILAERPTQADLDAYARGRPNADAAWRLAVKLRRCNDDILRTRIIQTAELSLNNNDPRAAQSAFILAGLGPHGIEALGRVLVKSVSEPQSAVPIVANTVGAAPSVAELAAAAQHSAEHASAALAVTPASALPARAAIRDFLIRNRNWSFAQNNIYSVLTKEFSRDVSGFRETFRADIETVIGMRPDLEQEIKARLPLLLINRQTTIHPNTTTTTTHQVP